MSVERILPPDIEDREPRPGDDDLVLLCCRRLTIEGVLRRRFWRTPAGARNRYDVEVTRARRVR